MANSLQIKPVFPTLRARELLRADKNDEAVACLREHLGANAADHAAWHQLAVAETQCRNYFAALKAIKRALALVPSEITYQRQHGFTQVSLGNCEAAIAALLPMLQASPEDYFVLHALQIAYCKSAKENDAIALGRKILQIEDRAAIANPAPPAKPLPSAARRGSRKVIAYSLWGASPVYNYGAMINARLAPFIYPGWKCRFYLGQDVPDSTRVALTQAGAEIIEAAEKHANVALSRSR